jgi:hypothetical protein
VGRRKMKANSGTMPERIVKGRGKAQYNYNIKQVTVEEPDGTPRIGYEYDYVEITGKITKAKIVRALEDSKLDSEEEFNPSEIEATHNAAKDAIELSGMAKLTYKQLDTYIDKNVTNLAEAKKYLKKLSKVVLAILKYTNVD